VAEPSSDRSRGGTGRNAIVHREDLTPVHLGGGHDIRKRGDTLGDLRTRRRDRSLEPLSCRTGTPHEVLVEHHDPVGSDGTDGELGVTGCADLARDHRPQRQLEDPRDFGRDHDTASGDTADDRVPAAAATLQQRSAETVPGFGAIVEDDRLGHRYDPDNSTSEVCMAISAYVLIQTEVGKAAQVASSVRKIDGVVTADDVTGPYDIIVKTEAASLDDLGRLVVSQIQAVEGITRTFTCPVVNL
jgi:Lrp/AsnC ligand binding domain